MIKTLAERQDAVKATEVGRTSSAAALSSLSYQLLKLSSLLVGIGDQLSAPAGQSSARWQVLAAIEDEALSVAEIARRLGQARQSVQRVADVLVQGQFAEYHDNPAHRRAKLLSLTATGKAALHDIQLRQVAWANRLSAHLDEAELHQASALLLKVQEVLINAEKTNKND